jgi:hypothetical protein
MNKKITISIAIIISLLIIAGIYFSIKSSDRTLPEPTKFSFGQKFTVEEKIINESGGEILIQEPNTPIDGIKIVFHARAVPDNTKVEVGYYEGDWKLTKGVKNEFTLPLILTLDKQLNRDGQPIEIHKKTDMAFQVDNATGHLSVMDTANGVTYTFRERNIITFTDISLQ